MRLIETRYSDLPAERPKLDPMAQVVRPAPCTGTITSDRQAIHLDREPAHPAGDRHELRRLNSGFIEACEWYELRAIELRSLKRAESLIDSLLAPYVAAAVAEDIEPEPQANPEDWRSEYLVPEENPDVLVGTKAERDAQELQQIVDAWIDAAYRTKSKSKKRPPCYELPTYQDWQGDSLDVARAAYVADYSERLAQANAHKRGRLSAWREYAAHRGIDWRAYPGELPRDDAAQQLLSNLWCDFWPAAIDGGVDISSVNMRGTSNQARPVESAPEPIEIPGALAAFLTAGQCRVLAAWAAQPEEDRSIREVSRQTGVWREAIEPALDAIRSAALPWLLQSIAEESAGEDDPGEDSTAAAIESLLGC